MPIDKEEFKLDTLIDIFRNMDINLTIVFVNTKKRAEYLSNELRKKDFTVSCMHGEMNQHERNLIMNEFRKGAARILISTDLLSRGIDVQQLSMVINFDIPSEKEAYIHRIGRSGRFGRKGVAINFILRRDIGFVQTLEKH